MLVRSKGIWNIPLHVSVVSSKTAMLKWCNHTIISKIKEFCQIASKSKNKAPSFPENEKWI